MATLKKIREGGYMPPTEQKKQESNTGPKLVYTPGTEKREVTFSSSKSKSNSLLEKATGNGYVSVSDLRQEENRTPGFTSGVGRGGGFGTGDSGFGGGKYKPKSEFAEYEERMKSDNPVVKTIDSALDADLVGNSVVTGMAQFNNQVAQTANLLPSFISDVIGIENKSPTQKWADKTKKNLEVLSEKTAEDASQYGKGGEVVSNLLSTSVSAAPNAILALASGGGSAITQLAPKAAGISGAISNGLKTVLNNPLTKSSFLQTVGTEYQNALDSGADAGEALVAAIGSSLVQSVVESGGGIETLPNNLRTGDTNKWLSILKSGAEEAIEEPAQNIVSGAIQKGVYDSSRPFFSTTDDTAVINPAREAETAAMAFGSGLLLGGAQNAVLNAVQGRRSALMPQQQQTDVQQSDAAQAILEAAGMQQTPVQTQTDTQTSAILDRAAAEYQQRGSVTNATATAILNDTAAVAQLEQNGLNLKDSMSQSQKRSAVKDAVARMETASVSEQVPVDVLRATGNETVAPDVLSSVFGDQNAKHLDFEELFNRYKDWDSREQYEDEISKSVNESKKEYGYSNPSGNFNGYRWSIEPHKWGSVFDYSILTPDGEILLGYGNLNNYNHGKTIAKKIVEYEMNALRDYNNRSGDTQSVGAAEAGFNTAQFPGQEKTSRVADTFQYNQYQAEATGMKKEDYDKIFRYTRQAEGKSQALAEELLYYLVDGKRTFLMDADQDAYNGIVDSLKSATAWNGPQTDAAYMIQRELQGRAVNGDIDETPYIDWLETMREHLTSGGQGVQANAKWTRADNVGGRASELEAWENLDKSDLSYEEKKARFQDIVRYDQQIANITQGDTESMKNIILDVARDRGVLNRVLLPGESKILNTVIDKSLNSLSFDQLKNLAYASTSAMSQDATPSSVGQKIKTVQVLSMLSLPTTTMSNLAGNTTFYGLDVASMRGAAILDMALSKITGTRSTAFEKGMLSRASMQSAVNALNQSIAEITLDVDMGNGESRYGTGSRRTFRADNGFLSRALSAAERNMGYALTATDQFYKGAAMSTEAQIQELIDQGKIVTTNEDYASDYAKNIAKYRTFQDDSKISVAIQTVHDVLNLVGIGDSGKTIRGKKVRAFGLGDIAAPFTRVAGNLVSRGLEYSPANIVKGTVEIAETIANSVRGNVDAATQAKAVSDLARGITGTAVAAGIMALVKAGLIKRADDESDEDVRALNASEGISGAQLNLGAAWRWINGEDTAWQEGDTLIDLSRLEPLNFLMNLGTELAKDDSDGIVSTIEGTANATTNAFLNAASELPVLQFVGNLATDTIKYGQPFAESLSEQAANTIVSSIIPNALRGTARALDDRPRNTYSSGTFLGNIRDSVLNSIPGLRETLPGSVDNYGNEKTYQGSDVAHFFDELFNPIGVNTYQQSEVSKELDSIRESTGDTSYFPDKNAPSSISYDNQKYTLTNDEKLEYQKVYGSLYYDTFRQAMETEAYQSMTPEEKAEFGNEIRSYADAAAKANYFSNSSATYENADLEREAIAAAGGATAADYLTLKTLYSMAVDDFEESGTKYSKKAETAKIIDQMDGLDTNAKAALWQSMNNDDSTDSDEIKNPYSGTLAAAGVPAEDIIALEEKYSQIQRSDADSRAQATEFSKWLDDQDFTPDQRALVEETYMYWNMFPASPAPYDYKTMNKTQQTNYDEWGKNFGWTETAFIDAYNAARTAKDTQEYKDSKSESKKDKIMKEALVAAGFTSEEASHFVRKFKW